MSKIFVKQMEEIAVFRKANGGKQLETSLIGDFSALIFVHFLFVGHKSNI